MIIDQETCIRCGECVFTCTLDAIYENSDTVDIDREKCVECGNCLRVTECPTGALQQDELIWPRIIRKYFSDNQFKCPENMRYTTGYGRGTEECKTNDRTGKFKHGQIGIVVELGRPNAGTYLYNAEKIIQTLMEAGTEMGEKSPMTALISDKEKGLLREDIRNERVLSCIVEGKVNIENLEHALNMLKTVSLQIDTVFSLGLVTRMVNGFESPIEPIIAKMGLHVRPNSKINLGMGRPLRED